MHEETVREEEPPSSMDNGARAIPAPGALARRLKNIGALLVGDWYICPIRTPLPHRLYFISKDIW